MSIYEDLHIEPIINACGTVTRLGGARMSQRVLTAFAEAAGAAVSLEALHAVAARRVSQLSGTDSALVTCGASAGLMLGAAAILARLDIGRMEKLPQTAGFPNQFIVSREHRNGYDHAVRAAGGQLHEVGLDELAAGAGVRRTEAWEFAAAVGPDTAGVLYTLTSDSQPPLPDVVRVAREHDVPVLVDAAAQLHDILDLERICQTGADLVAFSGGKALGGPQSTGILCGRRDLIGSAFLQMMDADEHFELWDPPPEFVDKSELPGMPRHGIGRMLKVSAEEIVALLVALDEFAQRDHRTQRERHRAWLEQIASQLTGMQAQAKIVGDTRPCLQVAIDTSAIGRTAMDVCRSLRQGEPPIYVGHALLRQGKIIINPVCLREDDVPILAERLAAELS